MATLHIRTVTSLGKEHRIWEREGISRGLFIHSVAGRQGAEPTRTTTPLPSRKKPPLPLPVALGPALYRFLNGKIFLSSLPLLPSAQNSLIRDKKGKKSWDLQRNGLLF